jgi:hypothetical protein
MNMESVVSQGVNLLAALPFTGTFEIEPLPSVIGYDVKHL